MSSEQRPIIINYGTLADIFEVLREGETYVLDHGDGHKTELVAGNPNNDTPGVEVSGLRDVVMYSSRDHSRGSL